MVPKDIILTHVDLDGAGCVVVLRAARVGTGLREELVHYCDYSMGLNGIDSRVEEAVSYAAADPHHVSLYITDIAPRREACVLLHNSVKLFKSVVCLDHHPPSAWMTVYPWFKHGDVCGARMVLEMVEADLGLPSSGPLSPLAALVSAIDAYDRWQLDSPFRRRGEELSTLCKFMGPRRFADMFSRDSCSDSGELCKALLEILTEKNEERVERILREQLDDDARVGTDEHGAKYMVLSSDVDVGVLSERARKLRKDIDYFVFPNTLFNSVSLRTGAGGMDVSALAVARGGNGHAGAAGFPHDFTRVLMDDLKLG